MFCDGNCKTKKKTCGLYITETLQEKKSGEIKTEKKCIFIAILSTLIRSEHQRDGLHAAANSARNDAAEQSVELKETLGIGLIGLIREARKLQSIEVSDDGKQPRIATK